MCIVSMIGDDFSRRHRDWDYVIPGGYYNPTNPQFEELKKEMQALKELLKAAKQYDQATNQPNCEHGEKVKLIKDMAKMLDVDLEDLLD